MTAAVTRRSLLAGMAGTAAGLVVSCSSENGDPAPTSSSPPTPTTPSPTSTTTSSPEPPVWPLTGLDAGTEVDHPVLAVKVDNTSNARPQVGLRDADIVVEVMVEGGSTRLIAMFHSELPDIVGPVRSVRTSDLGVVRPTNGALVASGGHGPVVDELQDNGVPLIQEGSPGFFRAGDRQQLYSVMVEPREVRDQATADVPAPEHNYLSWGASAASGEPATHAAATFSNAHTTEWEYTDGWRRANGLADDGDEFVATTLLILRTDVRDAGYTDPAGNFVPEIVLTGEGDAVLLTDGQAIEGTWAKDTASDPIVLRDQAGDTMTVPAGRTWIELVPESGSVSYTG